MAEEVLVQPAPEPKKVEVTTTMKDAVRFMNAADDYIKEYPKERSKLTYCLRKQSERLEESVGGYNKKLAVEIAEIDIRLASVHADGENKGNLIERKFDYKTGDERATEATQARYAYTPEKAKERRRALDDLNKVYENKSITIAPPFKEEPHFLPIPDGFDFRYLVAFKPFVFGEVSEADELRIYLAQEEKDKEKDARPRSNGANIQSVLKD